MVSRTKPIPAVVSIDSMDDETFLQHFQFRHYDQMAGLSEFPELTHRSPGLINSYRIFHNKLHELYLLEEPHEHEE